MPRRRELVDLKSKEGYRFAIELLHECSDHPIIDPHIDYFYHKEFGPPEELEKAKRTLRIISNCLDDFVKYLDTLPDDVNVSEVIREWPLFPQVPYVTAIRKKPVNP